MKRRKYFVVDDSEVRVDRAQQLGHSERFWNEPDFVGAAAIRFDCYRVVVRNGNQRIFGKLKRSDFQFSRVVGVINIELLQISLERCTSTPVHC